MVDKKYIILHDIRKAVYHEIGHYYMCRNLNVVAFLSDFTFNVDRDDYQENSTVTGRVKIYGNPDTQKMKLIGLAGEVIESMVQHLECEPNFEYFDPREIIYNIESETSRGSVSASDLNAIEGFNLDDVTYVADVLTRDWDIISEHAETIVSDLKKEVQELVGHDDDRIQ